MALRLVHTRTQPVKPASSKEPRLPLLDVNTIIIELSVEALQGDPNQVWAAVRALITLVQYHHMNGRTTKRNLKPGPKWPPY